MKLIFVTGGVMSGLGKGVTAASIAKLLQASGYTVTLIKMDPYLQIDAGTMSPFEHGETFVTSDGFETDLDLGHYERFINQDLARENSITTGQIYLTVIQNERNGKYLGKTVQVIPHVTNEIKERIKEVAKKYDVTVIEIGGTIGDIEGHHFIEAARQLKREMGGDVMFFHVVPILQISTSGEMKTKAIQHSVMKLREFGIHPNVLVCRSSKEIPQELKKKISMFCELDTSNIIESVDQESIYKVPGFFAKQGLADIIQKHMGLFPPRECDLRLWEKKVDILLNAKKEVTVGIAGKYTNLDDAYISVIEALRHAGVVFETKVNIVFINTELYEKDTWKEDLQKMLAKENISGIVVPGGFGSRGIEGKINVAHYARNHNMPYLGLCLGLQVATIAFARDYFPRDVSEKENISEKEKREKDFFTWVNSTEFCETVEHPVITIMESQKTVTAKGGTMRLGSYPALLQPHTKVWELYKKYGSYEEKENNYLLVYERHRHRYEVNPSYHEILQRYGLVFSGLSPDGELVEFIERPKPKRDDFTRNESKNPSFSEDHLFYVATQAHPEFQSRLERPHPLFIGFIEACIKKSNGYRG